MIVSYVIFLVSFCLFVLQYLGNLFNFAFVKKQLGIL